MKIYVKFTKGNFRDIKVNNYDARNSHNNL
jgi:hypothetical protein